MKIDMHCHSKFSKRPSLWLMQKLSCPESFTEPEELYRLCRQKGMSAVTITDHNVIEGCLEIAHLPNTFISSEYTTYFPENGCKVHVLAYDFSERQHQEMSTLRQNIYDLVDYFYAENIRHAIAHPIFWVNDRLTMDLVEKLVLLFKNWELNSSLVREMNDGVKQLVDRLTAADIERLANKHSIFPHYTEPWRKGLTAGSDDHSSLNLACAYTQAPDATNLDEFWSAVEARRTKIHCPSADPQNFSRTVYGIAYQFYKSKFSIDKHVRKDVFLSFLENTLQTRPETTPSTRLERIYHKISSKLRFKEGDASSWSLIGIGRHEAEKLIRSDPQLMSIVHQGNQQGSDLDKVWYEFVDRLSNKVFVQFGRRIFDRVLGGHLFDLFHSVGSGSALYALLAPYFASFSLFARQRSFTDEVLNHFKNNGHGIDRATHPERMAEFTDTYYEVNGIARTLKQSLASATALRKDYTILTCYPERQPCEPGVQQFTASGAFSLPEYPDGQLYYPPFLQMLQHCYEEEYTRIHATTPGFMGLAALGVARILRIPISGTYHTTFQHFASTLTDDSYVGETIWKYMVWYYNQLDAIFAPSTATATELIDKGIAPEKIRLYQQGVDVNYYHPGRRDRFFQERFEVGEDETVILYVGRIGEDKNLQKLADAYCELLKRNGKCRLAIVGDGSGRGELEKALQGTPTIFAGALEGEDLAAAYASCELLVQPNLIDTFGNVVLEAQASGIPVIVVDKSGPQENVISGETGLVVEADNAAELTQAMESLIRNPSRRETMGRAARRHMESRNSVDAFKKLWMLHTESKCDGRSSADFMEDVISASRSFALNV